RASRDPREGDGQGAHPRPRPRADVARVAGSPRRARGRRRVAGPRPGPTPPTHPRRRATATPPGNPGATPAPDLRRPSLDRRGEPGVAGHAGCRPSLSAPAAARELPPRIPARLGRQDVL